jgi:hypothetical protein
MLSTIELNVKKIKFVILKSLAGACCLLPFLVETRLFPYNRLSPGRYYFDLDYKFKT